MHIIITVAFDKVDKYSVSTEVKQMENFLLMSTNWQVKDA